MLFRLPIHQRHLPTGRAMRKSKQKIYQHKQKSGVGNQNNTQSLPMFIVSLVQILNGTFRIVIAFFIGRTIFFRFFYNVCAERKKNPATTAGLVRPQLLLWRSNSCERRLRLREPVRQRAFIWIAVLRIFCFVSSLQCTEWRVTIIETCKRQMK